MWKSRIILPTEECVVSMEEFVNWLQYVETELHDMTGVVTG
jgi:hypothetical protein